MTGRTYRSRKQRPCDACRRRKICCVRERGATACSLCSLRSTTCTYQTQPNLRRPRIEDPVISATPGTESREDSTEEWTPLFVGFSGDQDPFILRHCQFNGDYFSRPDWRCLRMYGNMDAIPMHFAVVPDSHLDTNHSGLPICPKLACSPESYETLITTYFDVVHTSFPILDGAHFEDEFKPLVALMCHLAVPFSLDANDDSWPEWRSYLHQALAKQGRSPRLDIIELGLLFTQRQTETHRAPNLPGLWPEIGSLVGMSHELGLNVDPSGWRIPEDERKRRIRLWWALFITDKWNALGFGRPSYIHDDNWNVPMLSLEDIPGRSFRGRVLPCSSARLFVAMSVLTGILSEILSKMYSIRSMRKTNEGTGSMFELFDHFLQRLDMFSREHLAIQETKDQIRNPTGTLTLSVYTVRIILYRAVVRNSVQHPRLDQVHRDAQQLATEVVHFVERLQVSHLRSFWWSPMSRTNFAIAGSFMVNMLLASTETADIQFWTDTIARYRTLLEMHSMTFDITKLAVKRMNLIASVIERGEDARRDGQAEGDTLAGDDLPVFDFNSFPSPFGLAMNSFLDFSALDDPVDQ